jgi:hypothetical protein
MPRGPQTLTPALFIFNGSCASDTRLIKPLLFIISSHGPVDSSLLLPGAAPAEAVDHSADTDAPAGKFNLIKGMQAPAARSLCSSGSLCMDGR